MTCEVAPERRVRERCRVKAFRFCALYAGLAMFVAVSTASAKPGWLTDFKQAKEEASAKKKLILVDFTGSDWCGWCIKLEREVFAKPEFQDYAKENLVLLEIDFPRRKEQPADQKVQNQELADRFQIQGFPTIIVLDGDGKKVGELGYTPGGPAAFIAELDKLRKG